MPDPATELRVDRVYGGQLATRSADRMVADVAARQHGVVSFTDLHGCGLSADAIERRVHNGHLHRLHRGVFAVGHVALSVEGRWLAAVKACRQAALSHFSGSALFGFVEWDDRLPEVTVTTRAGRSVRGVRLHRSFRLEERDVTTYRGIPVTTPTRTLIDLASVLPYGELRRAVRKALSLQRVSVAQLAKELARLGPRRGSANLTKVLSSGHAPTRSELEDVVLDLILRAGFEKPEVNRPLRVAGRTIIPDFRWPEQKLIIEADGARWHVNPVAKEDDAERQALLEEMGERVVRVSWAQVVGEEAQTLKRISTAGAPHSDRVAS